MPTFGFCSGTYQSESVGVDAQRCFNFYPEINGPASASRVALYPTPGKKLFCDLGAGPVGGLFRYEPSGASSPRIFAVAGNFTEIFENGTFHDYNFVSTELPVTMAANNTNQICICTGGDLWLFNATTNTAAQVATNLGKSFASVAFLNGYFLALQENSQTVWFSAVEDGTNWDALDFFAVNWYADNIQSMFVNQGLIWLHGLSQTIVYYNTTDPLLPFLPAQAGTIDQGTGAAFSIVKMDNSIFWIGGDERGQGIAWRANGYTPQRVSTHAIENAWRKFPQIADAVGYTYQDNGHTFWVIYFPSGNATYVYDAASGQWHERGFWIPKEHKYVADRSRCHVEAFGKHLVGDTQSGQIFDMSLEYLDDFGNPIRRYRRAPHINQEKERFYHKRMQVDLESGLGPSFPGDAIGPTSITLIDDDSQLWLVQINSALQFQTTPISSGSPESIVIQSSDSALYFLLGVQAGTGLLQTTDHSSSGSVGMQYIMLTTDGVGAQITVDDMGRLQTGPYAASYRGPLVWLRWSDDGGHTWKNEQYRDAGQLGEYAKRQMWYRLGVARDRVYEFGTAEPFACRVTDAYLKAGPASA